MKISIVWFAFLCCAITACRSQTSAIPDFNPQGKMVFIEDCDGSGGLLDYNFGDIVIYDPVTKQKNRLTHDKYYDRYPSWSPHGQKIVFESIRMDTPGEKGRKRILDLTDPRHLYVLDIKTG